MTMFERLVPDYGAPTDPVNRARYGYIEGWVGIVGNAALFALKLVLGLFINSIAVIADAFHSLSDVGTSGVVIFGFRMAKKPPDANHPFGHGRTEYIATLAIAILLIVTGASFVERALGRFGTDIALIHEEYAPLIAIIILVTALAKEVMARFSFAVARRIESDTLAADAWHHRTDMLSSVAVGVSLFGSAAGYPILDPLFAIGVAALIIGVGIDMVRRSSNLLLGYAPDEALIARIEALAAKVDGIASVHDIALHDYGTNKIVTLHAELAGDIPARGAHARVDALEKALERTLGLDSIVHMEPLGGERAIAERQDIERAIAALPSRFPAVRSVHKARVFHSGAELTIRMHIMVDRHMDIGVAHELDHAITDYFRERVGECHVNVHLEPAKDADHEDAGAA